MLTDFRSLTAAKPAQRSSEPSWLAQVVESRIGEGGERSGWEVIDDWPWCSVRPVGAELAAQGWKLHVAAVTANAEQTLLRVLPVLLDARVTFKFAGSAQFLDWLNSAWAPRASAGKFLTVYPAGDADIPQLAERLHEATVDLDGPRILSDRPYAPGSLVHYRYGGFVAQRMLSNDDRYRPMIRDPHGRFIEDRRLPAYTPPPWAACPFDEPNRSEAAGDKAGDKREAVLLAGRFLVRGAIRHANKGGVYRATDTVSGDDVIIKEARPYVTMGTSGRDAADALRVEARLLGILAPHGIAPRPLVLFDQAGHLFLAEELVPGTPLRRWTWESVRHHGIIEHLRLALPKAAQLVDLLEKAHEAGVILRDFNPNNVMVRPDGRLRLIDLELGCTADVGAPAGDVGGTLAYVAPEQVAGAAPDRAADMFGLGATLCFLLSGADPYFPAETPRPRPPAARLDEWLNTAARMAAFPGPVRPVVMDLMAERPQARATTADVRTALARAHETAPDAAPVGPDTLQPLSVAEWHAAVGGLVDHLLATRRTGAEPWPLDCGNADKDPCSVQHGAAGVVAALTRYVELTHDQRPRQTIAAACRWLEQRLAAEPARPPGLYFGRAGVAWTLHDAGRLLGDQGLVERALEVARRLPGRALNPDLTHGTAGIGLTHLHLAAATGRREFVERAHDCADALLSSVITEPDGPAWQTPEWVDSVFAGQRSHGFAHGTAGIACFLLAHGRATGRDDCLELARRAGRFLLDAAIVTGGTARWSAGPDDELPRIHWCNGASGIGTLLARLHRLAAASADTSFRKYAEMAAEAIAEFSWGGPLGQCHGTAGNAEFLLDLAESTGDGRYRRRAEGLARLIYTHRVRRDGRLVFTDHDTEVCTEWAGGVAGILAFLLRLRYGSPRQWLVRAPEAGWCP